MAKNRNDPLGQGLLGKLPKAVKPTPRKRLRRQATRLMKKVYAPAMKDLDSQEKKVKAISEKRKSDNIYYQNWLTTQTNQIQAHAQAADAELNQRQQQIQQQAADAAVAMRDKLLETGGGHVGTVSNAGQATAFDTSAEGAHAQGRISAEREATSQMIGSREEQAQFASASNAALALSNEAKRQADEYNSLKEVASARQKVILERAAKTQQEVARLLDREISKAQSDIDMRQIAAGLAIDLKNFKLSKKNYKLNKKIQTGELNLAKRAQAETERHNKAGEANDRANILQEAKQDKIDGKKEQQELQRKVKSIVNNTVSEIAARPKWQEIAAKNPNELVKLLSKKGVDSMFARAAVDLMYRGSLSMGSLRNLRNLGFDVPKNWK